MEEIATSSGKAKAKSLQIRLDPFSVAYYIQMGGDCYNDALLHIHLHLNFGGCNTSIRMLLFILSPLETTDYVIKLLNNEL